MKTAALTLAVIMFAASRGHAQDWRVYSSPNKSFSVELPAPLSKVKSFDGEHGVNFGGGQGEQGVSSYAAIEADPDDCRFGIIVISGRLGATLLGSQPRDKSFWYLSVLFIGDDDDAKPDIEREVLVNGLSGREYFYIRDEQKFPLGRVSSHHTRGRIFDADGKLYIVVFVGRKTADLTSPDAERFLNSFRVTTRR
jgi:hypothetical protein